jgi:hypothetical protein
MTFATLQKSDRNKRLANAKKHTPQLSEQVPAIQFPIIQAKLRIGAPNDRYEQEADRVAEQVMRMPDSEPGATFPSAHPANPPRVQCKCAACSVSGKLCPDYEKELQRQPDDKQEEEGEIHPVRTIATDEDLLLAAKADSPKQAPMRSEIVDGIAALRGGGRPLPPKERNFMEDRFGWDSATSEFIREPERSRSRVKSKPERSRWVMISSLARVVFSPNKRLAAGCSPTNLRTPSNSPVQRPD